jgi:hypothetical protein
VSERRDVHRDILVLPDPPAAFARLQVCTRVPVGIVYHNTVGTGQIEAYAAGFGGQHESEDAAVVVELQGSVLRRVKPQRVFESLGSKV